MGDPQDFGLQISSMKKYDPVIQRAIKKITNQGRVQDGQLRKVSKGLEWNGKF